MKVVLRTMEEGLGLPIPRELQESLGLHAGQVVDVAATETGLTLQPHPRKYRLEELLAENELNAEVPEDIMAWQNMPSVGKEIL